MSEIVMMPEPDEPAKLSPMTACFSIGAGSPEPLLKFTQDGKIFIRGELMATNMDAYLGMCKLLGVNP